MIDLSKSGVCNPGGGALCSSQAGGCKALYEYYRSKDQRPLAVRGSSAGVLNALMFVQGFGDQGQAIEAMERLWKNISHRKVHTLIPHLYPRTTGIFKTTPLRRLIEANVDTKKILGSGINLEVTASMYGKKALDPIAFPGDADFFDIVQASASYPIMFKPVQARGGFLADAGLKNNVPTSELIDKGCETIFIVRTAPRSSIFQKEIRRKDVRLLKLLGLIVGELMEAQIDLQLEEIQRINKEVELGKKGKKKIRLVELSPSKKPDLHVMEFKAKKCARAFDDGYVNVLKQLHLLEKM